MTTNSVSAVTLTATSTALNVALSLVPITSKVVTNAAMITAGRLISPPTSPPWRKPHSIGGPTVKAWGICTPTEFEQADDMPRPADRDRAGAQRIFEDQRPADEPGHQLAHHGIGVGVGRAGDGDHRGEFGIAEGRQRADEAGDDEADHHARPGLLRGGRGQHENAGADDRADAEQGQLERAERALQRLLLRRREDRVERFDPPSSALSRCNANHDHSPRESDCA